jgi:hypothetical protein
MMGRSVLVALAIVSALACTIEPGWAQRQDIRVPPPVTSMAEAPTPAAASLIPTPTVQPAELPTEQIALNEERRRDLISKLNLWENWYSEQSMLYAALWNSFTVAILVLTGLTSILVALGTAQTRKWFVAMLPAVAALLTSLSVQFRFKETWQLRERGHMDVVALGIKARELRVQDPELRGKVLALERDLNALDRSQATVFFDTLFQNSPRNGDPSPRNTPAGQQQAQSGQGG